ncbi:MAG: hypothetical protein AABX02_02105, partial [archaeon]
MSFILVLFLNIAYAHEEITGNSIHDANLLHDEDTGPSVNTKDVSSWENAAPFVLALFVGLGVFAFAIGLFLHPGKHAR